MRIGIYQTYWGPVGGGQRYIAVVAEILARHHSVDIVHHCDGFDPSRIEEPMQVDLSKVQFRYIPRIVRPNWPTINPLLRLKMERELGKEVSQPYDLYIDSSDIPPLFSHARRSALLVHFPLVTFEEYHGRNTEQWQTRSAPKRWLTSLFQQLEWRRRFATYQLFMVNSEFTKSWLKKLWGLDSKVVFPPVRNGLEPSKKQKLILSIGAFRGAQHKKHAMMIDAFKSICSSGLEGWRYVLLGACGPAVEDREYVDNLRQIARGFPIEIVTDATGKQVKESLGDSSILWHSMGYGVDADKEPRRMEHFGMVATEAMAAGCVPIVFNGGGLREIVTEGKTGYLWSTSDELRKATLQLTGNDELRRQLSSSAVVASQQFTGIAFEKRLLSTLEAVMH